MMHSIGHYIHEASDPSRDTARDRAVAAAKKARHAAADLYAAEAVKLLLLQHPSAASIVFDVDEDAYNPGKASITFGKVYSIFGHLIWPIHDPDTDLDHDDTICASLARAAEEGGPDYFGAPDDGEVYTHQLDITSLLGRTYGDPTPDERVRAVLDLIAPHNPGSDDAAVHALLGLNMRAYPAAPGTDDRSSMVVTTSNGVEVSVRLRAYGDQRIETFVHVDTEHVDDVFRPLVLEVDNGGESAYGDEPVVVDERDIDDPRDHSEEAYNRHTMHTDGDELRYCDDEFCPYYVHPDKRAY